MKPLLLGVLLLASSICSAEVRYLRFEFRGFEGWNTATGDHYWLPDLTLSGIFGGDDRNADQQISQDELVAFKIDGHDIFNCPAAQPMPGSPPSAIYCSIRGFHYNPGEVVEFSASYVVDGPHDNYYGEHYQTLDVAHPFISVYHDYGVEEYYAPTLGTSYLQVPVVPEPSLALMLAAGTCVVGLALRNRMQRSDTARQGSRPIPVAMDSLVRCR